MLSLEENKERHLIRGFAKSAFATVLSYYLRWLSRRTTLFVIVFVVIFRVLGYVIMIYSFVDVLDLVRDKSQISWCSLIRLLNTLAAAAQ